MKCTRVYYDGGELLNASFYPLSLDLSTTYRLTSW